MFFSFCLLTASAAGQSSVTYAPVALPEGQAAYVALPLHSLSAASEAPVTVGGGAALPSVSQAFGSTSYMLSQMGSQYSSQILPIGGNTAVAYSSSGFPDDPNDPFLNPVGDVPFALLLLLCGAWRWLRRRKTA